MQCVLYPLYFIILLKALLVMCEPYDNTKIAIIEVPSANLQEINRSVENHQENIDEGIKDAENQRKTTDSISTSKPDMPNEKYYPKEDCKVPGHLFPTANERNFDNEALLSENNVEHRIEAQFFYPGLLNTILQPTGRFSRFSASEFDPNTVNVYNFDGNIYPSRSQSSDEDILEQLEHDAIINNILPTMDEPFFRDAATYSAEPDLQMSSIPRPELVAYFSKSLAPPLLVRFQCTPKITRVYQQNLQVPLPYNYYRGTYAQDSREMDVQL